MSKVRIHNGQVLPTGVYFKNGAFHLVRQNRWHRLTSDAAQLDQALSSIVRVVPAALEDIARYAMTQVARSRANAKGRRKLHHEVSKDDVLEMLWEANWKCSVTGVPFSLQLVGPKNQRPFAPSIDRRDNSLGYVKSNCRMVCMAANIAMNTWGESVLSEMIRYKKLSNS